MNSQQVQDIRLMYEAVYNEELREKAEEYNNTVYDEDIVEVATEYFYTYGLNSDGVDILIEKVGLDNFVEFVYGLSEDLVVLTEARAARRRSGGPSYDEVKAKIDAKEAAKKKAKKSAQERTETERKEPESKGPDTEAKAEQPKSKKPIRDAIARQILAGMERHRKATQTAGRLASETGKTLGKVASVAHEAGRRAGEHVKKHGLKSLANEEYIDEAAKRTPKKVRGAKPSDEEWQRGRSDAGKRVSGDEEMGPRKYSLGRRVALDAPTKPGERPKNTPKLANWEKEDIQYRKANLKAGKTQKVGGERGLPESYDNFDYILEYLVAEGYADTNQDALVIMANMSQEDLDSIIMERTRERKGQPRPERNRALEFVRKMPSSKGLMTRSGRTIAQHEAERGVPERDRPKEAEETTADRLAAKKQKAEIAKAARERTEREEERRRRLA